MGDWIWIVVALVVVGILVVAGVVLWRRWTQRRRSARLRARFGPEYETAVHKYGRRQGEQHLEALLRSQPARGHRAVSADARDAVIHAWQSLQVSFVEAPVTATRDADQLVFTVMRSRGYPLETVDERATALSVDHAELAHRYRAAHDALVEAETAESPDVGRLRDAMLTYRDLLNVLVGPVAPGGPDDASTDAATDALDAPTPPPRTGRAS